MPRNWEQARAWLASGEGEELLVECPRCGRRGAVHPDGAGQYRIDWRDEAKGWTWRDVEVTVAELESPEFGCGYDRRVADGFIGNAPFIARPDPVPRR
jgi:hypothetical protein